MKAPNGPGGASDSCELLNLKGTPGSSDTGGMFHSAQTLAPLEGAKLERLRLSLNSPVVAVESLPVGPAAAGIAVHRAAWGARITIAVRAVRGGRVLFFHPDDAWRERESEGLALEAALSFAESMGFLFDEDPIERGAEPADAARLWADFLEGAAPETGLEPAGSDQRVEPAKEAATDAAVVPPCEEPVAPALLLSKFRYLSSIPAERLLSPPPLEEPLPNDSVLRLLSRF